MLESNVWVYVIYNNNLWVEFFVIITCKYEAFSRLNFYAHSSFYAQENRGICGVMLESNVGVYVIHIQCEFIPCINLIFYILS
jgi:hypothetical protein